MMIESLFYHFLIKKQIEFSFWKEYNLVDLNLFYAFMHNTDITSVFKNYVQCYCDFSVNSGLNCHIWVLFPETDLVVRYHRLSGVCTMGIFTGIL